jgi:hypothetical protein
MTKPDIVDGTSLIQKIMAHFGWYKTKMVDLKVDNLEIVYKFTFDDDPKPVNNIQKTIPKKTAKRTTTSDFKFKKGSQNGK